MTSIFCWWLQENINTKRKPYYNCKTQKDKIDMYTYWIGHLFTHSKTPKNWIYDHRELVQKDWPSSKLEHNTIVILGVWYYVCTKNEELQMNISQNWTKLTTDPYMVMYKKFFLPVGNNFIPCITVGRNWLEKLEATKKRWNPCVIQR